MTWRKGIAILLGNFCLLPLATATTKAPTITIPLRLLDGSHGPQYNDEWLAKEMLAAGFKSQDYEILRPAAKPSRPTLQTVRPDLAHLVHKIQTILAPTEAGRWVDIAIAGQGSTEAPTLCILPDEWNKSQIKVPVDRRTGAIQSSDVDPKLLGSCRTRGKLDREMAELTQDQIRRRYFDADGHLDRKKFPELYGNLEFVRGLLNAGFDSAIEGTGAIMTIAPRY